MIHRMNQTARISLQKPAISKSERQKSTGCAFYFKRCPPHVSQFFSFAFRGLASPRPSRSASRWHLSAAGEGVFTDGTVGPQVLFYGKMTFFALRRENALFS
jgi:hypothetical protein